VKVAAENARESDEEFVSRVWIEHLCSLSSDSHKEAENFVRLTSSLCSAGFACPEKISPTIALAEAMCASIARVLDGPDDLDVSKLCFSVRTVIFGLLRASRKFPRDEIVKVLLRGGVDHTVEIELLALVKRCIPEMLLRDVPGAAAELYDTVVCCVDELMAGGHVVVAGNVARQVVGACSSDTSALTAATLGILDGVNGKLSNSVAGVVAILQALSETLVEEDFLAFADELVQRALRRLTICALADDPTALHRELLLFQKFRDCLSSRSASHSVLARYRQAVVEAETFVYNNHLMDGKYRAEDFRVLLLRSDYTQSIRYMRFSSLDAQATDILSLKGVFPGCYPPVPNELAACGPPRKVHWLPLLSVAVIRWRHADVSTHVPATGVLLLLVFDAIAPENSWTVPQKDFDRAVEETFRLCRLETRGSHDWKNVFCERCFERLFLRAEGDVTLRLDNLCSPNELLDRNCLHTDTCVPKRKRQVHERHALVRCEAGIVSTLKSYGKMSMEELSGALRLMKAAGLTFDDALIGTALESLVKKGYARRAMDDTVEYIA
jgi:hypothetical protein